MRDEDKYLLTAALRYNGGFHLATDWYLKGFVPLPFQYKWHHLCIPGTQEPILNTTIIGGIAVGKTAIMAASILIDCLTTPYFRALSTSVTARQSELGFDMANGWIEGNSRLEHLVEDITLRPWPVIKWKNFAEWEFRTAGTDARFIRGSEFDRANFDEAGLDTRGEIVKVLRGRLRGVRPDGLNTPRMARLDVITSPADIPWLKERYYRGIKDDPHYNDTYSSIKAATWDNTHLTKVQVDAMEAEYPPDLIDVEMGGDFPDFGYTFFPGGAINECIDMSIYDAAIMAIYPEDGKVIPGYDLQEDPRHGIFKFELPFQPGRIYISAGDPGSGVIPRRDAACVIVCDVTDEVNRLVYFHWVSGKGSYNPFLNSYKYAIRKYNPVLRGIDATGPQKALDEIAFQNVGIKTDRINFTTEKPAMLNLLKQDITDHKWAYPQIKGAVRQLSIYTDSYDRKKGAQDIVMTMAEISYLRNFVPGNIDSENTKNVRRSRKHRTKTIRRR